MKNLRKLLILVSLCSIASMAVAQDDEELSRKYKKKDLEQLEQFEDGDYLFPPKPKNNWAIGAQGGLSLLFGDVRPENGWAAMLDVRKALGHAFSLRLQAGLGNTRGQNYEQSRGFEGKGGNPWNQHYTDPATTEVYYNYRMNYGEVSIQGIFSLNNVNFYKEQNRWNLYAGLGFGLMGYNTRVDALNGENEPYDFTSITAIDFNNDPFTIGIDGKRERLDALDGLLDGEFESQAEAHRDRQTLSLSDGDSSQVYTLSLFGVGIAGVRYRLNRRVELNLEYRILAANDDLLDGQRWLESGVQTPAPDALNTLTLGINFRLGKSEDALWWGNPLTQLYSDVQDARQTVKMLTEDSDGDGIPDLRDQEPDTPEGIPVDAVGRALDSDNDGFTDDVDEQPFSPKNCDVDEYGVAIDSDNDGTPDCYDKEPNSPPGMYYDANGVAIRIETETKSESPCLLPIIHFEVDRDMIKPEFYPEMYYIAQVMKNDPNLKVRAVGYADARNTDAYNLDLSKRRVNNAISFISNTYGIDEGRFIADFKGENDPLIEGLPDERQQSNKLEPLYYVNRRVEFECVREER